MDSVRYIKKCQEVALRALHYIYHILLYFNSDFMLINLNMCLLYQINQVVSEASLNKVNF